MTGRELYMKVKNIPDYLLEQIESALFNVFPARRKNAGNTPGYLLKQIKLALLSAFPGETELEMMLKNQFTINLDDIALGEDLDEIAYKVVKHFNTRNSLEDLINGALEENTGNPKLKEINENFKITTSLLDLLYPLEKKIKKKSKKKYIKIIGLIN
ncbi:MAG: hypothetical protein F6K26_53290 [Moorea sp. SIO2I5]|nr:hypothetical protein [Moorena sp. SIO2I5]